MRHQRRYDVVSLRAFDRHEPIPVVFLQLQLLVEDVPDVVLNRVQPVVALDRQAVRLVLRVEIKPEIALEFVVAREHYVYLLARVDFVAEIRPRYALQRLQLVHHVRTQDFAVFVAAEKIRQVILVAFVRRLQPFRGDGRIPLGKLVRASKYAKILKIRIVYRNKEFSLVLFHMNKIPA